MRRTNKALYELIMRNVSREVKKALNESEYAEGLLSKAINKMFRAANRSIRSMEDVYNYRLNGDFLSPYNDMYIEYSSLGYIPKSLRVSKRDVKNLEKEISNYLTEDYMYDAEFMNLYNDFTFKKNTLVNIVNDSKGDLIYTDKADIHFYIIKDGNTAVIYGILEDIFNMAKTKAEKADSICFVVIATKDIQFSD